MTNQELADLIEAESQRQNDAHYGITAADPHYIGGPSHNDDRLSATVRDHDGEPAVRVTDGQEVAFLSTDHDGQNRNVIWAAMVPQYVANWLAAIWQDDDTGGAREYEMSQERN